MCIYYNAKMIVIKLFLFMLLISVHHCRLPDKVYCVNQECKEPISKARTLLTYNSGDPDLISFRGNSEAIVYMKSAGTNKDLWYVSIDGKSGFVSNRFLRESKVFEKNPQLIVPVEVRKQNSVLQPDKVQRNHEIFEGTTIYTTEAAVNLQQNSVTEIPDITSSVPPTIVLNEDSTPPLENSNQEVQNQKIDANEEQVSSVPIKSSLQNQPHQAAEQLSVKPEDFLEKAGENIDHVSINFNNEINDENVEQPLLNNDSQSTNKDIAEQSLISDHTKVLHKKQSESNIFEVLTEIPKSSENENNNLSKKNNVIKNQELSIDKTIEPLPAPQLLSSSNSENTVTQSVEIPDNVDHLQKTIVHEPTDTAEQNTSNSLSKSAVDSTTQLPLQSLSDKNSPENIINQPEQQVKSLQNDNSMFRNVFSEGDVNGVKIVETSSELPMTVPAETTIHADISTPAETKIVESNELGESFPTTTENILASTTEQFIDINTPASSSSTESTYSIPSEISTSADSLITSHSEPVDDDFSSTTTETPITEDENTDGIFSGIYTTISDFWFPSTEAPTIDNIFNSDSHEQNTVNEKSEHYDDQTFSFMNYLWSTYNSVIGTKEETKALFPSPGETCFTDEYCESTPERDNRFLTFILTAATSVLLFTLGYYYIDNRRQDSKLIGTINSLQRDLLFTTKECELLKEDLATTKSKLTGIEDSSFGMDDMVQSLKEEIAELKVQNERLRSSLDDNEKLLRVSENTAGELQNTLGEVENTLSELLAERANSEEHIAELNGKIEAFEEELISVSRDRDNFQLKYVSAESALEESKKQNKVFEEVQEKLLEANNTIELQKHKISALKDAIIELKNNVSSNIDVMSLIDHTEIKAELSKALQEKQEFERKYEVEHKEKFRLAEDLKIAQESLHTNSKLATDAVTRLEVLEKYFQERESELMKELNAKESLFLSKQGESASTVEKIELLQQEVQRYKEKCDALTLELAEQESSRRSAVGELEARAHAAWLEARAARREADAARDAAAALRRKLASLSLHEGAASPHPQMSSPLNSSAVEAASAGVVPPPLPPLAFLPPPLLPPLPRPPPLGRLPSPNPHRYGDRRYSPESRYSPERRYSPESRYSPETVRYSPDSRYSPRSRRSPYSPRSRRHDRRYEEGRRSRTRNGPADTEDDYNSDSPSDSRRRPRYSRHSGPSSGSGCSSESDK